MAQCYQREQKVHLHKRIEVGYATGNMNKTYMYTAFSNTLALSPFLKVSLVFDTLIFMSRFLTPVYRAHTDQEPIIIDWIARVRNNKSLPTGFLNMNCGLFSGCHSLVIFQMPMSGTPSWESPYLQGCVPETFSLAFQNSYCCTHGRPRGLPPKE